MGSEPLRKECTLILLNKGLVRGAIAFTFVSIISLLLNLFQGSSALTNNFFFNGLIAFFLGLASVIYEIRNWSFLQQILVHYLVMLVTVFPTLLLSGMYPLGSFRDVVRVYFLFNKTGIILFLATYVLFKVRNRAYLKAQDQ
jgi:hypothetical protein